MNLSQFLFATNIAGVLLSLAFITYEIRTDRKRWVEERRNLQQQQPSRQNQGTVRCGA